MIGYDVWYVDSDDYVRCFSTYARNALCARHSAEEHLDPGSRITHIRAVDNFDW